MSSRGKNAGGRTVHEIDLALPRCFFVMRGAVQVAFGLTKNEMTTLVRDGVFAAKYPIKNGRARFLRSQVLAVARKWENAS